MIAKDFNDELRNIRVVLSFSNLINLHILILEGL